MSDPVKQAALKSIIGFDEARKLDEYHASVQRNMLIAIIFLTVLLIACLICFAMAMHGWNASRVTVGELQMENDSLHSQLWAATNHNQFIKP